MIKNDPKVADYIDKLVAAAPPLTPAQRDRLASLLRPVQSLDDFIAVTEVDPEMSELDEVINDDNHSQ